MEIRIQNIESIRTTARTFIENVLPGHHIVAFYGKMGAGKTTFIKALCAELGVNDEVTSPTFALVNEYSIPTSQKEASPVGGRLEGAIFHFDFYRIKRLEEVYDLGYEDYFYRKDALCLIEWPELIEELLPDDTLRVEISEEADGTRKLIIDN